MDETSITVEVRKGARSISINSYCIGDKVLAGRADEAGIKLNARDISRHHCNIYFKTGGFLVEDLSLNGIDRAGGQGSADYLYGDRFSAGEFSIIVSRHQTTEKNIDIAAVRRESLSALIEQIDLNILSGSQHSMSNRVEAALDRILFSKGLKDEKLRKLIKQELKDEALGLGPLENLLRDESISEIMVIAHNAIYVEEKGRLRKTDLVFTSEESVRTVIDRIIAPLGRRIDESSPMVDARLADGSRVNAVISPLAIKGAALTIRKFSKKPFSMDDLVKFKTLNREMASFLKKAVDARQNIVISGGTGSGKTTLLNVLSAQISNEERVVTIEDAAELQLQQPHLVSLETKPANVEGRGEITIRDLVRNALRMRPDRIIVGECRGKEALDMLQAMNTGHDGSLTTTHANSPAEAVARLETLSLMAGLNLPSRAVREQIAGAVDIIVQQSRFAGGERKITSITEVAGMDDDGSVKLCEIYSYNRKQLSEQSGEGFVSTGWLPGFLIAGEG